MEALYSMNNIKLKNSLLLLLAAVIWGTAFVAQSVGMDFVGPFTFNGVRSLVGGIVLIPCILFLDRMNERRQSHEIHNINSQGKSHETQKEHGSGKIPLLPADKKERKLLLQGGFACGLVICIASNMQQFGMQFTTVGKAGFITACYIVLVPILGMFLGKKTGIFVWISVALAVVGLYLLCMTDALGFGKGDLFVLGCAFAFAVHILVIDHYTVLVDGVRMSCIQFLISGVISCILMVLFETPTRDALWAARVPILYAGVMSCGVAYTLQIVGQKDMNPTVASLILSLESCISVLSGWVILKQELSVRELLGCVVMFGAILIAQMPVPGEKKKQVQNGR